MMMMMIAPNSRAGKEGKERGIMEELQGRRRGMLATGEWWGMVRSVGIWHETRFENGGSV